MTHIAKSLSLSLALAALVVFVFAAPVFAASIEVDTTGVVGKTNDTVLVPVVVKDASDVVAWQVTVAVRDDERAKVAIDSNSVKRAGAVSGGRVVYWFDASDAKSKHVSGSQTLFYLAVTPKTLEPVQIELEDVRVYETSASNRVSYDIVNATLFVNKIGSGVNYGGSGGGATVLIGVTDDEGSYVTEDKTGVLRVFVPRGPSLPVTLFTGSSGAYPLPDSLKYFSADEIYPELQPGEEYNIVFGVDKNDLYEKSKAPEDLFVLHCINGVWYESPTVSVNTEGDTVCVTAKTWSSGAFVLGYDKGGASYATEDKNTAVKSKEVKTGEAGSFASVFATPLAIPIIVAAALAITAALVFIKLRRRD